jgi:uncharacterized membrane protein
MKPEAGILSGMILLIGVVFHFIPRLRKRSLYFGVTVADEFRESAEGCVIARDFRVLTWAGTLLALIGSQLAFGQHRELMGSLAPELQVALAVFAWLRAWHRTKRHAVRPAGVRSAEIAAAPRGSMLGLLALLLPPFGPVAAGVFLWWNYSVLPEHWGRYTGRLRQGDVDHFIDKSPLVVFTTPAIAATVLLLCLATGLGIRYASRRGSSGEQAGWASKFRRLNLTMLAAIMWIVSLMTSVLSVAPLLSAGTVGMLMPLFAGALVVAVAGFAVPLIRMSMQPTGGTDATPDDCWKGGAIYYNPSDPALMVEKRSGIGYTLNFGNRLAWVILAFILLLPVFITSITSGLK